MSIMVGQKYFGFCSLVVYLVGFVWGYLEVSISLVALMGCGLQNFQSWFDNLQKHLLSQRGNS